MGAKAGSCFIEKRKRVRVTAKLVMALIFLLTFVLLYEAHTVALISEPVAILLTGTWVAGVAAIVRRQIKARRIHMSEG